MCMYGGPRLTQVGFLDHSPYTEGGGRSLTEPRVLWTASLARQLAPEVSHLRFPHPGIRGWKVST